MISIRYGAPDYGRSFRAHRLELPNPGSKPWAESWSSPFREKICTASLMLTRMCGAGRAGTRLRSEALHQSLTIGRPAADRAGAGPKGVSQQILTPDSTLLSFMPLSRTSEPVKDVMAERMTSRE